MRLEKIDLNLFVVFDAIYRERSVTRVAQRLHLTQPAVSNALGRLRQTFDDPLFVRTTAGMQPTPLADTIVTDVRKALGLLRDSVAVSAEFDPAASTKTYRLGMNELSQMLLLPELQARISREAPLVTLQCYYVDRASALDDLKSGDLDLVLDVPQASVRELAHRPLGELPYVVAMRRTHPLAAGPLQLDDYLAARHLLVSGRRRGRGQADVALQALGLQRDIAVRVQGYTVGAAITASDDLLWTAPAAMALQSQLHVSTLPFDCQPLRLHLYWPREADQDPTSCWMRDRVAGIFSAGLGRESIQGS